MDADRLDSTTLDFTIANYLCVYGYFGDFGDKLDELFDHFFIIMSLLA